MKQVKIIGVPEHFNYPWQMCIENGEFQQAGIQLEWENIPEGTGKMCEMLREGSTDLAVILTEGLCKDIAEGNPSYIIQKYVASPLQWGIHVAHGSNLQEESDLKGKKIAISRYGSGSHLMAIVHALHMGWNPEELEYVVINTLEGAIEALSNGTADYFMWDRFMTQPVVDQNIFRRIGVCPTPWPSFVVASTQSFYDENKALVKNILHIVNQTTQEFKIIPSIDKTLAEKFGQKLEDIQQWLHITRWSQKNFTEKEFIVLNEQLTRLNITDKSLDYLQVVK